MPTLFDHHGRPVKPDQLKKQIAAPDQAIRNIFSNNRIFGETTLAKLGSVIRAAEQGDVSDLQTYAGMVERRDLHVASVLQTRRLAVLQAPWGVTPSDKVPNGEVHSALVSDVMQLESFPDLLYTLSDASYRGFAASEIVWDMSETQWMPRSFEERDQRWYKWNDLGELRLRDNSHEGLEIEPFKFLIHRGPSQTGRPQLSGLMYPISAYYTYKQFSLRDWLAFAEIFGMPIRLGKHQHGATPEDIRTLQRAVQEVGSDAGAVIPEHMSLELLGVSSGNSGGGDLYKGLLEWVDKAISKGVLGQTMTSEDGSSEAQALVHQNVRYDLLRADAERISKTLKQQLVIPLIDLNFGPQADYPTVAAAVREPEDLTPIVDAAVRLIEKGLPIKVADLYKLTGFNAPEPGDEVLGMKASSDSGPEGESSPDSPDPPK